ncbi:MAG: winged helix-turn-helix transcriptional regulator [Ilumatobacter sp.]
MRRTRFDDAPCPIARTTDLIGDWWTPLVMREAFSGARRFGDFAERLDIPRAVLAARLARLVDDGLLVRVEYQQSPVRHEYRLTDKGRDFWGVLAAMWRWGTDHLWDEGEPPIVLQHRKTGDVVRPVVVDEATGEPLDVRAMRIALKPDAMRTS